MMCQSEYLLSPEDLISFSPLVHSFAFKKHPVFFVKTSGVVNLCIPDYQPRYFQNVVLVSCFSDSYGPFDSARVMNSAFQTVCPTEIPTEITGKNRGGDWEHAGNAHRTGGLQGNCAEFVEKCHLEKKTWTSRYTQVDLAGYFLGRFLLLFVSKSESDTYRKTKQMGLQTHRVFIKMES